MTSVTYLKNLRLRITTLTFLSGPSVQPYYRYLDVSVKSGFPRILRLGDPFTPSRTLGNLYGGEVIVVRFVNVLCPFLFLWDGEQFERSVTLEKVPLVVELSGPT